MSEGTEAIIRSLTKPQRAVMDTLGCGGEVQMSHPKTLAKLVNMGLIMPSPISIKTRLGIFTTTEYFMPVHAHIAWCAVAAAEFAALTPEEQAAMEAPDGDKTTRRRT